MSQKSEKYARNLRKEMEDTKTRMTCTEEKVDRLAMAFDAVHSQAMENARQESAEARRQVRQAERKARTWKHIAYAALVAAIIVEIIAIWAVRYKEPEVPPLVVLPEEQVVVVKQIGAPTIAQLIG
jgi:t-SNARE complex subunit (syntaxin)